MSAEVKPEVFIGLLREGRARVHADGRRAGVILPPELRGEKHVALDYGRSLPVPTTDVEVDGYGIKATLSFDRIQSVTFVPWGAVYAITDGQGRGRVWVEDLPDDVEFRTTTRRVNGGHQEWIH